MRRSEREITDKNRIIGILEECSCCRLGLCDNGIAYIVPMNFGIKADGDTVSLYFHCAAEGKKLDLIGSSDKASFEADDGGRIITADTACGYTAHYKSVMGVGSVSVVESDAEKRVGLNALMRHYTGKDDWEFPQAALSRTCVLRLCVEEISAKESN